MLLFASALLVSVQGYAITDSSRSENSITPVAAPANKTSQPVAPASDKDEDTSANQADLEQFWLNQRDLFFNQTTFNLTKRTNELVGEEHANRTYHLPFWFDYEMFKNLTERVHADADTALKRHHIYIDNCVSIWKSSALKRLHRPNNFTFIDLAEDWVSRSTVLLADRFGGDQSDRASQSLTTLRALFIAAITSHPIRFAQTQTENYNEEWNEHNYTLSSLERRESPVGKALRLVQEELVGCAARRDKNLCIMLLIDLDVSRRRSSTRLCSISTRPPLT